MENIVDTPFQIIDSYNRWKEYQLLLYSNKITIEEFNVAIDKIKEECVSIFGTDKILFDYVKSKNKIS